MFHDLAHFTKILFGRFQFLIAKQGQICYLTYIYDYYLSCQLPAILHVLNQCYLFINYYYKTWHVLSLIKWSVLSNNIN